MQLFGGLEGRVEKLEAENAHLFNITNILAKRLAVLEKVLDGQAVTAAAPVAASKPAAKAAKKEESDDDFNFSDSEEEDAAPKESAMERMKRMGAEKKAADAAKADVHVGPITKSNVVMDCKPWDDETDLGEMEAAVRAIKMEGLTWGDAKHVEIGYGIKKLRISNCIVDHLVGLYDLEEKLTDLEDFIQSVDIVSHNKI